jgi:hypothetical protein
MTRSEFRVGVLIGRIFILLVGLGGSVFTVLIIKTIVKEFSPIGLIAGLVYSMISIGFLYTAIDSLKIIKIDPIHKRIVVNYLGIYKKEFKQDAFEGYNLRPFSNNLGVFRGAIIQLHTKEQFNFSSLDFRNYNDLEHALFEFLPLDKNIKINYFTPFAKALYAYVILIVVIMVIFKGLGN